MTPVIVQFQEILHVHRNEASSTAPKHTVFSFMADFKYTPYVTVPGFPRLEPGMKVQAVLERDGDWQSLVGWRDLHTGVVTAPNSKWQLYRAAFLLAWVLFAAFLAAKSGMVSSTGEAIAALLVATVLFALLASEFRAWRRARHWEQVLHSLPPPHEA